MVVKVMVEESLLFFFFFFLQQNEAIKHYRLVFVVVANEQRLFGTA